MKKPPVHVWVMVAPNGIPEFVSRTRRDARLMRIKTKRIYKYILG